MILLGYIYPIYGLVEAINKCIDTITFLEFTSNGFGIKYSNIIGLLIDPHNLPDSYYLIKSFNSWVFSNLTLEY